MSEVDKTLNSREVNYGSFADNAFVSQMLKAVIESGKSTMKLTKVQSEALDMICSKISRIIGGDPNYADNWHDIAGYATLVEVDLKKTK